MLKIACKFRDDRRLVQNDFMIQKSFSSKDFHRGCIATKLKIVELGISRNKYFLLICNFIIQSSKLTFDEPSLGWVSVSSFLQIIIPARLSFHYRAIDTFTSDE